eukprot:Sspe_Gene.118189::Locus_111020_Transcript_2_2_Confidence_0.667_Length_1501::g.118189::m.118189
MCTSEVARKVARRWNLPIVTAQQLAVALLHDSAPPPTRIKNAFRGPPVKAGFRARLWGALGCLAYSGERINASILASAMAVAARHGDLATTDHLFKLYERRALRPNVFAYNAIISGALRSGNLPRVHQALVDMKNARVQPTKHTYSLAIRALALAGDEEGAKMLLVFMTRRNFKPSPASISAAISACKTFESASSLITFSLRQSTPEGVSPYNSLLNVCVRARDFASFRKATIEMGTAGIEPDSITWAIRIQMYRVAAEMGEVAFDDVVAEYRSVPEAQCSEAATVSFILCCSEHWMGLERANEASDDVKAALTAHVATALRRVKVSVASSERICRATFAFLAATENMPAAQVFMRKLQGNRLVTPVLIRAFNDVCINTSSPSLLL